MSKPFRIGIAGLGTVGAGVIKVLTKNADIIALRAGRKIEISAVSARNKNTDRGVDLSGYDWVDNAADLAHHGELDAVIELIGGSEGVAADLVNAALDNSRHVVTANKALLAHHGYELALKAEDNGVSLAYEAAVAGGVPIIKALREGLAANKIHSVYGILNGTCNYILTMMRETGRDFAEVLKEAQELGYAEEDPTFDVEGIDAAHKLCLITAIAFGVKPDFEALGIQGITNINATDITSATDFGYRIKLLGIAREVDGEIMQNIEPCLVPIYSPMGIIEDVYNAVYVEGDYVESPLFTGKGAGEGPTASSVVADIIDLARGIQVPTFGVAAKHLKEAPRVSLSETRARYYLRLNVTDRAGVIADISSILRDQDISIESLIQHGRDPGQVVPIILTCHETRHAAMVKAVSLIESLDTCAEKPCLMRIEEL
ncbi:MAG: homoserine dehydrogenase [Zetaproteobacteria bacterium]|nr:MAG: homoserine dehydrogenase [Zetaproteobacteria bacterium]